MTVVTVTAKDLNNLVNQRRADKEVVFEHILKTCLQRVVKSAKNQKYRCVYEVPDFVLGFPLYRLNDAILYVVKRLENDCHLHTQYIFPRIVYISWDMDEITGKTKIAPLLASSRHPVFVPITEPSLHAATPSVSYPRSLPALRDAPQDKYTDFHAATSSPAVEDPSPLFPPLPLATAKRTKIFTDRTYVAVDQKGTQKRKQRTAFRAITDFKPSGKFVLNID
jgi:hypothetical protein